MVKLFRGVASHWLALKITLKENKMKTYFSNYIIPSIFENGACVFVRELNIEKIKEEIKESEFISLCVDMSATERIEENFQIIFKKIEGIHNIKLHEMDCLIVMFDMKFYKFDIALVVKDNNLKIIKED